MVMGRGKDICKQLKAVRRRIADENGIPLEIKECTFKGECRGTCPRCEAEVQYLESELENRIRLGKVATVAGVALGLASCGTGAPTPIPDDTMMGEEVMTLHENDTADVPPPPEYVMPDGFLPELEGIVSQDGAYRMVPTKDTLEHLKDTAIDWEQYYPQNSMVNCEDWPVVRGESGSVVVSGNVRLRPVSRLKVPESQMEEYKANEERDNRRSLPTTVEYDEVDGVKVVKQNSPTKNEPR